MCRAPSIRPRAAISTRAAPMRWRAAAARRRCCARRHRATGPPAICTMRECDFRWQNRPALDLSYWSETVSRSSPAWRGRWRAKRAGGGMRAPVRTLRRTRALRREMTLPEIVLWQALRRSLLGLRFRRQHPIGPYVLDFYCPSARLAIEIDGLAHDRDRKSTRLNSSHVEISYAVF